MCQSMVDIQPAAAEIRRGIKKNKIEITGQKYSGPPITYGGHNKLFSSCAHNCSKHSSDYLATEHLEYYASTVTNGTQNKYLHSTVFPLDSTAYKSSVR